MSGCSLRVGLEALEDGGPGGGLVEGGEFGDGGGTGVVGPAAIYSLVKIGDGLVVAAESGGGAGGEVIVVVGGVVGNGEEFLITGEGVGVLLVEKVAPAHVGDVVGFVDEAVVVVVAADELKANFFGGFPGAFVVFGAVPADNGEAAGEGMFDGGGDGEGGEAEAAMVGGGVDADFGAAVADAVGDTPGDDGAAGVVDGDEAEAVLETVGNAAPVVGEPGGDMFRNMEAGAVKEVLIEALDGVAGGEVGTPVEGELAALVVAAELFEDGAVGDELGELLFPFGRVETDDEFAMTGGEEGFLQPGGEGGVEVVVVGVAGKVVAFAGGDEGGGGLVAVVGDDAAGAVAFDGGGNDEVVGEVGGEERPDGFVLGWLELIKHNCVVPISFLIFQDYTLIFI
jgi:hypothetical protein